MRVAVMGSGAVGSCFGAKLALAGHDLTFIARGSHLTAMRRNGLRIESSQGILHIEQAVFSAHAEKIPPVDLVLFCVKSYDTETAARAMAPLVGAGTLILSLQNGVDNAEKLAHQFGAKRILAGVVYIAAQLDQPGVIRHFSGGKIVFGSLDVAACPAAERLERTLSEAGIHCAVSPDIHAVQWAKLLWNAPFCAISCLTRATAGQIARSAALTRLALDCMAEVHAAARTRGVDLPRKLFDETVAFSRGLGTFEPSMLQDLKARKPLEYEAFNGIVVRLLRDAGEAAPVNQSFHALLQELDRSNRNEAVYRP